MVYNAKIVAVWGNSGSGKTFLSSCIAQQLSLNKNRVVIINEDRSTQTVKVLLPFIETTQKNSLGYLMQTENITEEDVVRAINLDKNNEYIGVMSFVKQDNAISYIQFTTSNAYIIINYLKKLVDYIIIDCKTEWSLQTFSTIALENANISLRVLSADLKGLSFNDTMPASLPTSLRQKQILVLNSIYNFTPQYEIEKTIGQIHHFVPHSEDAYKMYNSASAFSSLNKKKNAQFISSINHIVERVINET